MADPLIGVVVVAAGAGSRYGGGVPKAFVELDGRSLLGWSVACCRRVLRHGRGGRRGPARSPRPRRSGRRAGMPGCRFVWCPAARERPDSVAAGLAALPSDVEIVLVHDAARALTPSSLFATVAAAVAAGAPAVVPGLPVVDTVKQVDEAGIVVATPARATAAGDPDTARVQPRRARAGPRGGGPAPRDRRRGAGRGSRPAGPRGSGRHASPQDHHSGRPRPGRRPTRQWRPPR